MSLASKFQERPTETVETTRVLYWIYAARLVVAVAVYGSAMLVGEAWYQASADAVPVGSQILGFVGLATAAVATLLSYLYSHRREHEISRHFLYVQAFLDIVLVTGIVHLTGGSHSVFPPLFYVATASAYALILPFGPALLVALYTGVAYLSEIWLAYPAQMGITVWLQVAIFTAVASVSSVIGGRLRQEKVRVRSLEGELRRLRLDTTDILRTVDTGVATLDDEGHLAYMNPAAERLLGVDVGLWLGRDFLEAMDQRIPDLAVVVRETMRRREPVENREILVGGSDGAGRVPVAVTTRILERPQARPSLTLALQDLRPARRLEELRIRMNRLEAVAELSASLAHEIRNPLASIRSAVEQLGSDGEEGAEDDEMLERLIVREADRLNRLLEEFNDFARVDVREREPLDLEVLVREAVEVVERHPATQEDAVFELDLGGPFENLWGDLDILHRTMVNLLLNAVQVQGPEASPRIRIVADELRPDLLPSEVALGSPVRLRVIDDGPGIPEEDLERIFEPFYTRRSGGTGLGLSIAHRAIQAHGGALLASSREGEGATFVILLPRRDPYRRDEIDGPVDLRGEDLTQTAEATVE